MNRMSGFTLIEVLVAMAITAIATMLAYSGLDNAVKMSESAEAAAEHVQQMNRVFDIMGRDFHQSIARPVRSPDGDTIEPAFYLNTTEQPMLKFTRAGWVNPAPSRFQRSELQRVNYQFDGNKVIRYSWQMLDRYPDSTPQEVVLFEHVRTFEVKVLSDVGTVNSSGQAVTADQGEWIDTWPIKNLLTTESNLGTMPIAIEIIVDTEDWGKIRRVYELSAGVRL